MCGVFAYSGAAPKAAATVMDGLRRLEYRGYDSWGVAVADRRKLDVQRQVGRISGTSWSRLGPASIGLGHTRWATHGRVTEGNAHPHTDCHGRLAVVHNGIVENHVALRAELVARSHRFTSETDTEVIAHLLEEELATAGDGADALVSALRRVGTRLEGASAVVVLDGQEQRLAALRHGSPLLVGIATGKILLASDAAALLPETRDVVFLQDGEIAAIEGDSLRILDAHTGRSVPIQAERLDWTIEAADQGDYPHFMLKEIAEQPNQWRRMAGHMGPDLVAIADALREARQIVLLGCGTAYHAALIGRALLASVADRSCQVVAGSEWEAVLPDLRPGTICLALSQSGETADVLEVVRRARQRGAVVAALVNAPGSSLARLAHLVAPLGAGPESCVLATKSFTAKVAMLLRIAALLGGVDDTVTRDIALAADAAHRLLEPNQHDQIRRIAVTLAAQEHLYVLGRGVSFPIALEAALKVKEGSYVHAEGFAGGELKHGVIALIEAGTPCLLLAPDDATRTAMLSGAAEVSARGGCIIGASATNDPVFDSWLRVGDAGLATPLVQAMAVQLLAYEIALARGVNPDRPRNLAKSVTVK